MFLLPTDFDQVPYSLPNLKAVINTFQPYVNEAEETVLRSLLGTELYNAFLTGLGATTPEQKWVNLRDGADYVWSSTGKTYHWVGLKKLLRPYIYAMWLRDTFDTLTGNGLTVSNVENGSVIAPTQRIAKAYNQYAMMAGTKVSSPWYNSSILGSADWFFADFFLVYTDMNELEMRNTLYGFLTVNADTYPGLIFNDPGTMNTFNI